MYNKCIPRRNRLAKVTVSEGNFRTTFNFVCIETKRGKQYQVRKTFDGNSIYKCPGCNHSIAQGSASLTVIEQDHIFGEQAAIDERRHWHESCWKGFN